MLASGDGGGLFTSAIKCARGRRNSQGRVSPAQLPVHATIHAAACLTTMREHAQISCVITGRNADVEVKEVHHRARGGRWNS